VKLEPFEMERLQSQWENRVAYNLSESGVHPLSVRELPGSEQIPDLRLGYSQTNGTPELRERISSLYPGASANNILVTSGASEANFLCIWRLIEPGDEVILMLPITCRSGAWRDRSARG
jgi:aspartate/methionine/tyrosine aminotransferase